MFPSLDTILKSLESIAKYSWAFFVVCAFVIFLPDETANKIGILEIRKNSIGFWWIALVFTGSLWITSLFGLIKNLISKRLESRKQQKQLLEHQATVFKRLDSLTEEEKTWLACCLYEGTQTITATFTNHVAQSLKSKGILIHGEGHILGMPFHIRDDIWQYICEHREEILPSHVIQNPNAIRKLRSFKESLTRIY